MGIHLNMSFSSFFLSVIGAYYFNSCKAGCFKVISYLRQSFLRWLAWNTSPCLGDSGKHAAETVDEK